ncbi:MAG: ferritin-like domain-containing protein [Solirubrobacterales bacterium]
MTITRRALAGRGLAGAAALALGGPAVSPAGAATPGPADLDLAEQLMRAELAAMVVWDAAAKSSEFGAAGARILRDVRIEEQRHAEEIGKVLSAAGRTPPQRPPVEQVPGLTAVRDGRDLIELALAAEQRLSAAYVRALGPVTDPGLRFLLAQLLAGEAAHLLFARAALDRALVPRTFAL